MNSVISVTDKPNHTILISGFFMLTAFIFNFLLIPRFSLLGAALAGLFSGIIGVFISFVYLYRKLRVVFPFKSTILVVVAALMMYWAAAWFTVSGWFFIPIAGAGLLLYLLLLYLFGELQPDDWQLLSSLLQRRPLSFFFARKK